MSNSSLVDFIKISPNSTNPRNNKISKITIHHMAGDISVETCGNVFAPTSAEASANYGIDSDGRVGMYVEEKNRSWASSSQDNDHQSVTIEVANDGGEPNWHVSDKALNKLIELCVDICKRNGINKLNYTGDARGNLTRHNMFTATICPGPYLQSKFSWIAEQVNKRLGQPNKPSTLKIGDEVKLTDDAKYTSGQDVPNWVINSKLYVRDIYDNGDVVISTLKTGDITGVVSPIYIKEIESSTFEPYLVKVIVDSLNIRAGAGINYPVNGCIKDQGVYTIIEEKNGWGFLKSKVGWICLEYTKRI